MMVFLVNLLVQLNNLLGGQLGITLIVIGVGIRLVFHPLLKKQQMHAKKMQGLQPKLKALKNQHGDDKTKFAQAQAQLFKDEGVNPAAGCLPLVVQIVVFGVLYNAISRLLKHGISTQFLMWDLGKPDVFSVSGIPVPLPGVLILLAAASQLIMSKMMLPQAVPVNKEDKPKEKEQKTDLADDLAQAQGSMVYMFPLMFIFFGYRFPAGLSLYWASSTVVSLIQQYMISGWGGLEPLVKKIRSSK